MNDGQNSESQQGKNKVIIKNQTARRIDISLGNSDRLIIPPFGSRTVTDEILRKPDSAVDAWEKQNLISMETVTASRDKEVDLKMMLPGCSVMLLFLFLLITIPLASFTKFEWSYVLGGSVLFVIFILIGFRRFFKHEEKTSKEVSRQFQKWLAYLPSLLMVIFIGIGMPVTVVYLFGGGTELLKQVQPHSVRQAKEDSLRKAQADTVGQAKADSLRKTQVDTVVQAHGDSVEQAQTQIQTAIPLFLGRSLQLGIISIASILPALMYFMFGRQQLEKLRDNFIREVMMLDPNVETISEAGTKYDPLFNSVYGSGNTPLGSIPIYVSTMLITFGWILTFLPIGQDANLLVPFAPHAAALNFGFLGVYFFAINMAFRRYVRADLTTKTYTHISIRFLVTLILVWVVSSLSELLPAGHNTDTVILLFAFIIGIFPETGLAFFHDLFQKIFGKIIKTLEEEHPLTNLEGITLYDRARLLEEGVDNIENLAHHNLAELVARTRIPTSRLVDLFDQAVLYLHLGLEVDKLQATRQQLREYGIRTATDLQQVMKEQNLLALLKDEALVNRLKVIDVTLSDDEWMAYLRHWRKFTALSEITARMPEDFYTKLVPDTTGKKDYNKNI